MGGNVKDGENQTGRTRRGAWGVQQFKGRGRRDPPCTWARKEERTPVASSPNRSQAFLQDQGGEGARSGRRKEEAKGKEEKGQRQRKEQVSQIP